MHCDGYGFACRVESSQVFFVAVLEVGVVDVIRCCDEKMIDYNLGVSIL